MSPLGAVGDVTRQVVLQPQVQVAVKAGVASVLAWLAAELVSGELQSYAYYAPLGAVVAMYPTVAGSVRASARAVAALAIGCALGLVVHATLAPSLLTLALVVAAGVGLGGLPFLGEQSNWVPVAALFVLIVGGSDADTYAAAYVSLMLLGVLVGVAVNLCLPALRLGHGRDALRALQDTLAGQLEDLADGLRQPQPPGPQEWRRRMRSVSPVVQRMRDAVGEIGEAQRGNPRARRHQAETGRQYQVARALERVGLLVEDLAAILVETYRHDVPACPLDPELAAATADALEKLAALLRHYHLRLDPDDERLLDVQSATERLTDLFGRRRDLDPEDVAVLGAVVANLRRSLAAVAPRRGEPSAA